MKKFTLFLVAILAMVNVANAQRAWAYDLELTPSVDSYKFAFKAVTAGDATLVFYKEGEEAGTLNLSSVSAGDNTVTKTSEELLSAIGKAGDFTWGVKMSAGAIALSGTYLTELTAAGQGLDFYLPQGLVVDNNPESETFSSLFIAEAQGGKLSVGPTHTQGIYHYSQTLAELNTTDKGIIPSNVTLTNGSRQEMHRIAINPKNNHVAFAHNVSGKAAVWSVPANNPAGEATNLIAGTSITMPNSICFDENGVLYVMDNANATTGGTLYKVVDGVATKLVQNKTWQQVDNSLAYDGRGGIWIAQTSTSNTWPSYAILSHVNSKGEIDWSALDHSSEGLFSSGNSYGYSQRGQCAYNVKEDLLVLGGNCRSHIFQVTYNAAGAPSLTLKYRTPFIKASTNIDGAAFDYAGDLYLMSAARERLYKYVVPTTNNTCTVPAKKSQVITLVSATPEHNVTITVNGNGTVTGANTGTYLEGTELTLTASPADHYDFVNWTYGSETSTDNPLTITVNSDMTITANFKEHTKYTITAVPNNEDMGTVTGGRQYYVGESATLKATAKSGYVFAGWEDGEKNATRTITVSSDATYTANFQAIAPRAWAYDLKVTEEGDNYKFTFNATTAGTATLLFADIDGNPVVPTSVENPAVAGTNTILVAKTAFTENKDVYWSVKMDGATIPAISEITDQSRGIYDFYNMMGVVVDNDTESEDFGKIYIQQSFEYTSGTTADRNKTQKAGIFIYDQGLNELNPTNEGYKPTMPTGYTAIGKSRESFKRLAINPTNGNLVFGNNISGQGSVWTIGRDNLTAEATNIIEGVTGIDKVNAICYDENGSLYVLANITTGSAKYNLYKFTAGVQTELTLGGAKVFVDADVAMTSDGRGGLWIAQRRGGITQYSILSHVNVAEDKVDFVLDSSADYATWFSGNCYRAAIAYNAAESIVAVQGASKILLFKVSYDASTGAPSIDKYLQVSPVGTSVDGLAFDYAGDLYTVNSGSEKFQKFTLPTDENICTVPAPSSQKLVLGTQCEVTVSVNDPAMGSVEGAGQYEKGAEVTLKATPAAHHRFVDWTGDKTSTDNPFKFTIEGDVSLTANFEAIPQITISVTSNDDNMGTVSGGGTYDEGAEVTISATAKASYRFVKWNDEVTDATRTFPAAENLTLQAIFEKVPNRAWAYDLSQVADGDNYKFSFVATTAGEATLLFADKDGNELVVPYVVGAVNAGTNTITLSQSTFTGVTKDVYWSVKMDGEVITAVAEITDQAKGIYDFVDMTGVLVDNNPDSKYFGKIYVQMALDGTIGSKTQTAGLFIFDQTLAIKNTDANAGIQPILPSGYSIGDNRNKFHRLNINPNTGDLVYSYNIAGSPAVFAIDRENLTATNLIAGVAGLTHTNAHCFDEHGTLYVMDNASYPNTGAIYKIVDGVATEFVANANWANASITMASDGRGGLWVSQNRGQLDGFYQLTHVTSEGKIDWYVNSSSPQGLTGHSRRGALAYDVESQILAQGRDAKVELYSVEYDATTGVPTLTSLYTIADATNIGNDIDGLAFDYAGDLYVVNTTKKKFQKFTIPTDENICTVPAPASQKLVLGTQCEVTVTVNDPAMGSVEGAGQYEKGATVTLTPNPVAHHRFVNWTGDKTSTDNPLKFTIEGDVNLTANFEAIPQITITVTSNDDNMGTVSGSGTYDEGQEVTIAATAKTSYRFVKWNDEVTDATRTFPAAENLTLQAIFEKVPNRAWAYDLLQVADGDNYKFSFVATTAGEATLLFADKDGNELLTPYVVGAVNAGANTVTLLQSTFASVTKDVYWSVKMDGEAITSVAEITDPTRNIYDFYNMMGVVVDNDPNSDEFGKIYIQQSYNGASDGIADRSDTQTAGIFIYNQALEELNAPANTGIKPQLPYTIGANRQVFKRITINPSNGDIAFCNNTTTSGGAYAVSRENLAGEAVNLTKDIAEIQKVNALCFDDEGNLYVVANVSTSGSPNGNIYQIKTDGTYTELTTNGVNLFYDQEIAMASDGRGGLWIAQNRWGTAAGTLFHVNVAENKIDFKVEAGKDYSDWFAGANYRGAIAYDKQRDIIAVHSQACASVFQVTYAVDGTPSISKICQTPNLGRNELDGLAFDYAGDLYVVHSGTERFYKYVIPTNNNTCTVPAPASQKIEKEKKYTVTVVANPADGGIVSVSDGGNAVEGATLEVSATANTGYRFVNWTKGAEVLSAETSFTYTVSAENVTIVANFEALPEIVYELNGGVWNKYGWTSKKDMYDAFVAEWKTYSSSSQSFCSYETQLGIGNSNQGLPTAILSTQPILEFMAQAKWAWLGQFLDALATAQGKAIKPTEAVLQMRYGLGNFFGEDNNGAGASSWIGAVDCSGDIASITAFAPYWGQTFPMPTQPTEEVVLNAPYKEGNLFDGWYAASDFSGAEVTIVDETTNGTLYAKWIETIITVTIDENADNTTILAPHVGKKVTATVTRYFGVNKILTVTLPFDMSAAQISTHFGNATVYKFYNVVDAGEELHLQFSRTTSIEAGKPYIIQTAASGYEAENGFTIENVTINTDLTHVEIGGITMVPVLNGGGTLDKETQYYLSNNALYCAGEHNQPLPGLRAFFTSATSTPIRARVIFDDNEATSIPTVIAPKTKAQKIIKDGRLIIIRGEHQYNAQGQMIE